MPLGLPRGFLLPQTDKAGGWDGSFPSVPSTTMRGLVDAIRLLDKDQEMAIESKQLYLTGMSMGAFGVYEGLAKFPGFFAAGIAISAVSQEEAFSRKLDNLAPLWVAVNSGDRDYAERLRKFRRHYLSEGGDIRLSVFDQKGHNAWDALLKDHAFRQWLFRQKTQ